MANQTRPKPERGDAVTDAIEGMDCINRKGGPAAIFPFGERKAARTVYTLVIIHEKIFETSNADDGTAQSVPATV